MEVSKLTEISNLVLEAVEQASDIVMEIYNSGDLELIRNVTKSSSIPLNLLTPISLYCLKRATLKKIEKICFG